MKKFAIGVLAVCMVVLLVVSLNGGFDDVENNEIKFNEAAFSLPSNLSGAQDITGFLVGDFDGEDGSHLSFDGQGGMRRIGADGMVLNGSYKLLEQGDGSAMVRFTFEKSEELYAFSLNSPTGGITLQDADGNATEYVTVMD